MIPAATFTILVEGRDGAALGAVGAFDHFSTAVWVIARERPSSVSLDHLGAPRAWEL